MIKLIIDDDLKKEIINKFRIDEQSYNSILQYFNGSVEPEIVKKYLSHLVSSVRDLINEKKIKKHIEELKEQKKLDEQGKLLSLLEKEIVKLFSFKLNPTTDGASPCRCLYKDGVAIITYDSRLEDKQKRIYIAHEIGHILIDIMKQEIGLDNVDIEKCSSLFAFFAILDKDLFYTNKASDYIHKSDIELLNEVIFLCKI